ncbi:hypothetical protein GU333_08505 [Lactococcus raffinolactis]|uniref:hypothetical protein n=1 Tax=Pseudolactococcus raffinolactis TaxID=1366 RepID=UPI001436AB53|nr:hypothetical protein [Lactococcus raffinolactis]QIW61153.1 hypothetical protein GU333_08505 [Lactococcus raffinolactis]
MTIIINKKNLVCSPKLLVVTRPLLAFSGVALATPENAHSPQPTNLQHQFYQYVLATEFFESRVFSAFAKLSFLYLEIEGYHYETHTTV